MRIYWTIDTIPELAAFSKEERRRIWRKHALHTLRYWRTWGCLAIHLTCMILGALFGAATATLIPSALINRDLSLFIGAVFGLFAAGMIGALIFSLLMSEIVRKEIKNSQRP